MPRGLYVHIPFCKTRCHYCNFVTTAEATPALREKFFASLELEIREVQRRYGKLSFETLYIGGGTPSSLRISEMTNLMGMLRRDFIFAKNAEVTCEWNPGDGDNAKCRAFAALGINRVSLGAQSFQDTLLKQLGRRHSAQEIRTTLGSIRGAGIQNVSLDLMLRIPKQVVKDFRQSLETCVELQASQVSLYDLEVHKNTIFGLLQEQGKLNLPDEKKHARMYQDAIDLLTSSGYEHYEISNFAKPGFESKHNLIYWHNQEYLGLGPGAFSYLEGMRYQFAADLERYLMKCETGNWHSQQEDLLTKIETEKETFIMELRLQKGVSPEKFPSIYPQIQKRLKILCGEKFLEKAGQKVRLTARGKFLSESVFGFLLQKEKRT